MNYQDYSNFSNPTPSKNNQGDVIKNLMLELQASGRISKTSEEAAVLSLGIKNSDELWKLIEQKRNEDLSDKEWEGLQSRSSYISQNEVLSPNHPGRGRKGWITHDPKEKPDVEPIAPVPVSEKVEINNPLQTPVIPSPEFIFGTPIWQFRKELPKGVVEWALSFENKSNSRTINPGSNRGGFQSEPSERFDAIPSEFIEHVQSIFMNFPLYKFTNWWVNINKKGDYNVSHTHPGSDLTVIWFLTDNNRTLNLDNPNSHNRYKLQQVLPQTQQNSLNIGSSILLDAHAGDFIVFPADIRHSVEEHKLDTSKVSVSFNLSFKTNDELKNSKILTNPIN